MSNPASSSRTEHAAHPWYRNAWPWLLAAGPLVVIVASLLSAWLAIRSDDGLVAEDYYKRGLLINQELRRTAASEERALGATVTFAAGGEVRVRMRGLVGKPSGLRLRLAHPTRSADDRVIALVPAQDGEFRGTLAGGSAGRWVVILEADQWRLPTTIAQGPLHEIRLGAAAETPHG
jgi:hypothetical protein